MSKLEEILKAWDTDSVIDSTEPGKELLKIPTLHNKYLKILVNHRLAMKRVNFDYARMRKIKEEYYNGSLSQEELENISISNALYSKHQQLSAAYQLEAAALTSLVEALAVSLIAVATASDAAAFLACAAK